MRRALGSRGARLLERGVQSEQVGGEDAHGSTDQDRGIAAASSLPAGVITLRRHFRLIAAVLRRAGLVGGRPDVVAERLVVAQSGRQAAQRVQFVSPDRSLIDQSKHQTPLVPGYPEAG